MNHLRKFALVYGLAVWTVIGALTMGGGPTGLPGTARSAR